LDWIDGRFRKELEDTGMGYGKEIETLKLASELGLFTLGYAFNVKRPKWWAKQGWTYSSATWGSPPAAQ
jgi:predicted TIM-barrel enzyme